MAYEKLSRRALGVHVYCGNNRRCDLYCFNRDREYLLADSKTD